MSSYLDLGTFVTVAFTVNSGKCHLTLIWVTLGTVEFAVSSVRCHFTLSWVTLDTVEFAVSSVRCHFTLSWVTLDTVEFAANSMRRHLTLIWVLLRTVKFPVSNKYMFFIFIEFNRKLVILLLVPQCLFLVMPVDEMCSICQWTRRIRSLDCELCAQFPV